MKHKDFWKKHRKVQRWIYRVCPAYLPLTVLEACITYGRPFLSMYFAAEIINEIVQKSAETEAVKLALILILSNMALALIQWAVNKVLIVRRREVEQGIHAVMAEKSLTMDYQVREKTETQDMVTRISEGNNFAGGIGDYCQHISSIIGAVVSVIYALILLVPLFFSRGMSRKGIAGFLDSAGGGILVLVLLIVGTIFQYCQNRKINEANKAFFEVAIRNNRRFGFFCGHIWDYARGKGVRVYGMLGLLKERLEQLQEENIKNWRKNTRFANGILSLEQVMSVVCLLCFYIYVGVKTMNGTVSLGELTFYVGTLTTMMKGLNTAMLMIAHVNMTMQYLINYVDFLELANEKYDGTIPVEKRLDNEYELEFRNVSFHYPNNEELVLDHINAKIRVGGKLTIVGKNGSGKSTFIKLLCRLYDPTEGEILLNGIDIRKYDYDEYRELFGVVFQDFQLFSFSIAQNVAAGVNYEEERIWECIRQAGLEQQVKKMEHGIEEVIYKQEDEGVEISGGEAQKLAIARALYKNAPVVILDEPTAALDPVSELEIYEHFDEMVEEKTAIYISHRMSSCRFCEHILVFDHGGIVQMGSHEALLQEKDGLYAQLWNAQAKYYASSVTVHTEPETRSCTRQACL